MLIIGTRNYIKKNYLYYHNTGDTEHKFAMVYIFKTKTTHGRV